MFSFRLFSNNKVTMLLYALQFLTQQWYWCRFIISGWLLVAVTFILCGVFVILDKWVTELVFLDIGNIYFNPVATFSKRSTSFSSLLQWYVYIPKDILPPFQNMSNFDYLISIRDNFEFKIDMNSFIFRKLYIL